MNKSNPGSGKSVALSSAVFLLGPIFAVLVATVYKLQAVAILGGGP